MISQGSIILRKMSRRPPLTHFLCVPLVTSVSKIQLEKALGDFSVRASCDSLDSNQGTTKIPAKAIRPLGTMHLTLGVMSLDAEKLGAAKSFLRNFKINSVLLPNVGKATRVENSSVPALNMIENVNQHDVPVGKPEAPNGPSPNLAIAPLAVTLKGIQPMHGPASTTILFASPTDYSSRLFPLCESLRQVFTDAGYLLPDSRPLKLHATIVNTVYVKERRNRKRGGGHGKDKKEALKIDATEVIEEFKDFVWMEDVRLDRVSICERGAKKLVIDGRSVEEYLEVESIALP